MSYAANGKIMPMFNKGFGAYFPGSSVGALPLFQAPANLVMACHAMGTRPAVAGDDVTTGCIGLESGVPAGAPQAQGGATVYCAGRYKHSGGSVYLMSDGHSKWFRSPDSWRASSGSGTAYRKSLAPSAAVWFRED